MNNDPDDTSKCYAVTYSVEGEVTYYVWANNMQQAVEHYDQYQTVDRTLEHIELLDIQEAE